MALNENVKINQDYTLTCSSSGVSTASCSTSSSSDGLEPHPNVQILLKNVENLVRLGIVAVPSAFTRLGSPIIYLPDANLCRNIRNHDLQLLFRYYLTIVPIEDQAYGFTLIVGTQNSSVSDFENIFQKVIPIFPAEIQQIFINYHSNFAYQDNKISMDVLVKQYLYDYDVYHIENPTFDLSHFIDPKYIPSILGKNSNEISENRDIQGWIDLQMSIEDFSLDAKYVVKCIDRFVNSLENSESEPDTAYHIIRRDIQELTARGLYMLKTLQRPEANIMQKIAMQILCQQLDQAWAYISRSWKVKNKAVLQNEELNTFQQLFRELAKSFSENDKLVRSLPFNENSVSEINKALEQLDTCVQWLNSDTSKARNLRTIGHKILREDNFASDCIRPKCNELETMCCQLDGLITEKRRRLHKFLALYDELEAVDKWCASVNTLIKETLSSPSTNGILSKWIERFDWLLSHAEHKLQTKADFEEMFEDIKDLMSAETVFNVDDTLERLNDVTLALKRNRNNLLTKSSRSKSMDVAATRKDSNSRLQNIFSELLSTEHCYVTDMGEILFHYRSKLKKNSYSSNKQGKSLIGAIFGNLPLIYNFHYDTFNPQLKLYAGECQPEELARVFTHYSSTLKNLYSFYCQNMANSFRAVNELTQAYPNLLNDCQRNANHMLPLSAYLLKPMQRLTKYQLLLKDLANSTQISNEKSVLENTLSCIVSVVRIVNNSLHEIIIKHLPKNIGRLGNLIRQSVFKVISYNKGHDKSIFGNRPQQRQIFLYENFLVICKLPVSTNSTENSSNDMMSGKATVTLKEFVAISFQFKHLFCINDIEILNCNVKSNNFINLKSLSKPNTVYRLEARTQEEKEDFESELKRAILKTTNYDEEDCSVELSSSPDIFSNSGKFHRSSSRGDKQRTRSLSNDNVGDKTPNKSSRGAQFVVLADYSATSKREVSLQQNDVVTLEKVGCAGWWYVRHVGLHQEHEGWAPSTYLQKLHPPSLI